MQTNKRKFEYKWVIFAVCFMMVFFCLGFCCGNKGMYLKAMTSALDMKRSIFSINDSIRYIATAVCNLFFGSLIARFGARKLVTFGFVSLILSMVSYILAEGFVLVYVGGLFLGIGMTFTTNTMASYIIKRWFKQNIGVYLGFVFAANGVGSLIAVDIISPIINDENNAFGYRNSYTMMAIILFIVGIIVVSLLREQPKGYVADTTPKKKKARKCSWSGIELSSAKKMPAFFIICGIVFLTGFVLQAICGVYYAHLRDVGIDETFANRVTKIYLITLIASKFINGIAYDKFGLRTVVTACHIATVVSFLILIFVSPTATGKILAVIFGIFFALALPLETIIIPLIVDEVFGDISYDKILGIMMAMNYSGYAIGTPVVNLCYDLTGSYSFVFLIFIAVMVVCSVAFNIILSVFKKKRNDIIANAQIEETAV